MAKIKPKLKSSAWEILEDEPINKYGDGGLKAINLNNIKPKVYEEVNKEFGDDYTKNYINDPSILNKNKESIDFLNNWYKDRLPFLYGEQGKQYLDSKEYKDNLLAPNPVQFLPSGKEESAQYKSTSAVDLKAREDFYNGRYNLPILRKYKTENKLDQLKNNLDVLIDKERSVYINPSLTNTLDNREVLTHENSHKYDRFLPELSEKDSKVISSYTPNINTEDDTQKSTLKLLQPYITKPTEVKSRLMEIRKRLGILPTDVIDEKKFIEIQNKAKELFKDKEDFSPLEELKFYYKDNDIIDLLNKVSENKQNNEQLLMAKNGGVTIKTGTPKRNPETQVFEQESFKMFPKKEPLPTVRDEESFLNKAKKTNFKFNLWHSKPLSLETYEKLANIPSTFQGETFKYDNPKQEAINLYNQDYKEDEKFMSRQLEDMDYYNKQLNWHKNNLENPAYLKKLKGEFPEDAEDRLKRRKDRLTTSNIYLGTVLNERAFNVSSNLSPHGEPEFDYISDIFTNEYGEQDIGETHKIPTGKRKVVLADTEYAKKYMKNAESILPTLAVHEGQHLITNGDRGMSDFAKNLYKEAYIPSGNEKNDEYYGRPTEIDARKKALEYDMERFGIKKYEEKFTPKHYKKVLELRNKLSDDSKEFLDKVKPEKMEEIFNRIAYNPIENKQNNEQLPMAKNGGSINKYPNGGRQPIIVNDKNDPRLQNYNDSLKLFNSYQELKNKLNQEKYINLGSPSFLNKKLMLSENEVIKEAIRDKSDDSFLDNYIGKFSDKRPYIKASKEGNLYKTLDFFPGIINEELGFQYFSDKIKPKSEEVYRKHKNVGDARLVKNYDNVKPIQQYIYEKPITKTTVGDITGDKIAKSKNNVAVLNSEFVPKQRPKEQFQELTTENKFIPETEQHLDFDPIGLKKGTYFTRPRQQQESQNNQFGRKGVTDYFDKKTGKLLKTYKNGGKLKYSQWEIID